MSSRKAVPPGTKPSPANQTTITTMLGVVVVGICGLFFMAYLWFRPGAASLIAEYISSPTPTREPIATAAPTRTPVPNLTATQGAWIKPAVLPSMGDAEEARSAVDAGISYIESFAFVFPETPEINQPGDVYVYEIQLTESVPLVWAYGWCATTQSILEDNFSSIRLDFLLNESVIPSAMLATTDYQREDGSACREIAALVQSWISGTHHLETRITFAQAIHDGWNLFPAGTHTHKYVVTLNQ